MSIRLQLFQLVLFSLLTCPSGNPTDSHAGAASAPPPKMSQAVAEKKAAAHAPGHAPALEKSPSDVSLNRLIAGNKRFATATMAHPDQTLERREDLALSQSPFAIIVSCSDSRVPPEIIFDQGVGDLFVIRVAGEVVGESGIGSIEYAVSHLGTPLIMVLGHERCGAVAATLKGGDAPGSIGFICAHIQAAVDKAKTQNGDTLENAIRNNVSNVAETISKSPVIRDAMAKGAVKIVRGVYDLDDGLVKPIQ